MSEIETITFVNCSTCQDWGVVYVKAGTPNLTSTCPACGGVNGSIKFVDWARQIATLAHRGQYREDKHGKPSNEPYIAHPDRVSQSFDHWPAAQATSWLHDTLEDNPKEWNRLKLEVAGIPQDVIEAVELLTRSKTIPYEMYLTPIRNNPIARAVKIADMRDNIASTYQEKKLAKYSAGLLFMLNKLPKDYVWA